MLVFAWAGMTTAGDLDPVVGEHTDADGNPIQTMPTLEEIYNLVNDNIVPTPCYETMNGAISTGTNPASSDGGIGVPLPPKISA